MCNPCTTAACSRDKPLSEAADVVNGTRFWVAKEAIEFIVYSEETMSLVRASLRNGAIHGVGVFADDPNLIDIPDGKQEIAARDITAGEELTCNCFTSDLEAARKLGQI